MNKESAHQGIGRIQVVVGTIFLLSAASGVYLLVTDGSLWRLALSHAIGLVIVVVIDIALGAANLSRSKRVYVPSMSAAALALVLQVGDVATAPQYGMTVAYFAKYLFGLWAFDLLLVLQGVVLALGVVGRSYAVYLSRRRSRRGSQIEYSRRGFLKSAVELGAIVGLGVVVSSIKLPVSTKARTTTTTRSGPAGSVANVSDLKTDSPVYFEYPAGYPNILMKAKDGTVTALSILCTHVCCQVEYLSIQNVFFCPCHGSVFGADGSVVRGPAEVALPSVQFTIDPNGFIFPTGINSGSPCMG